MKDPLTRFRQFLDEAVATGMVNPNAMTVSSVDDEGHPSSRMVLLKDFDQRGFVFYTNLESRKGIEIQANPRVSLNFYWRQLGKQVVIHGEAQLVSDEEADAYFATRERTSQLGAWASHQSRKLDNRARLVAEVARYGARFVVGPVPRPPYWSGFRVQPHYFEFWVSRPSRLHDRIVFEATDGGWKSHRLYP